MSTLFHERRKCDDASPLPPCSSGLPFAIEVLGPGGAGAHIASDPHVACGYERQRSERAKSSGGVGCRIDRATTIAAPTWEVSASAMCQTRAGGIKAARPHAPAAIGVLRRWIGKNRKRSRARAEKPRTRRARLTNSTRAKPAKRVARAAWR